MKIDEVTALRLYSDSKFGATCMKESTAHEEGKAEIVGVPCVVQFGFSSKKECTGAVSTSACVWIFSGSCADFFGSSYLPVCEESDAPSILNSTIDDAIEQAKANPKLVLRTAAP